MPANHFDMHSEFAPERKPLPIWILLVSAFWALMEILVSLALVLDPKSVAESVDVSAKGMEYVMQMWAVRQFALGAIFAFATYRKSAPMLLVCYLFFLVMFLGDLAIGISQKENGLIVAALVMIGIAIAMLLVLKKKV